MLRTEAKLLWCYKVVLSSHEKQSAEIRKETHGAELTIASCRPELTSGGSSLGRCVGMGGWVNAYYCICISLDPAPL